ncbi:MAG: hypothetical protein ACRC3B_14415, partial [Bacteroidia bacterium]
MPILLCAFVLFSSVRGFSQSADSTTVVKDTLSSRPNSPRAFLCRWKYTGQNVSGLSIIGISDYYAENTSGYRVNGLQLSISGGVRELNGVGLGVGLGFLSFYHTVNGVLINPFSTCAIHLRGAAAPCVFMEIDTLDGIAPFSLIAINWHWRGFTGAGIWQLSGTGEGVGISGIGH